MNKNIIILDENTINQIAAGEVIEQPSSVVKEIVENCIDAGATKILIGIQSAGLKEIKVVDNGIGIDEDDIERAFTRYGTSKIDNIDDLYTLSTMGFRGEALASISSVSKVKITSRTSYKDYGITMLMEGGEIIEKFPENINPGTRVVIRELFYNTPVRQKFLRSPLTETRDIIDIVEKLALSRPDISFELMIDGKIKFKSKGNNNLKELVGQVFSYSMGRNMLELHVEDEGIILRGMIGNFNLYRSNRDNIIFFVNGRYVISQSLSKAFENAYKNRLPLNKFPVGVVYLDIPQYLVEVNIHPRKLSVKIDDEEKICDLITKSVEHLLLSANKSTENKPENLFVKLCDLHKGIQIKNQDDIKECYVAEGKEQLSLIYESKESLNNPFYGIEIFGTISNTYIIARLNDILYIIDQHAAHERINYEDALRQFEEIGFKTQMLIEPYVLNLNNIDYIRIVENIDKIMEYGILLESFGDDAFLIRGLPLNIIGEEASVEFLLELIDTFEDKDSDRRKVLMLEKAACSRSIKAGSRASISELEALMSRLGECEFPYTCPHGRPTFIKYDSTDLEKIFLRS